MRKIEPSVGATIVWRTDEFPFIAAAEITNVSGTVLWVLISHDDPVELAEHLFCVSAKDGEELQREIVRLRLKHDQAVAATQRIMADHRKRSVLGQLDPRP